MLKIKKVKAPIRIDFAGGTTDIEPFASKYGGVVLNAAINHYIIGELTATDKKVSLKYQGNIPTSSGLGTSGVMNLVWLALISKTKNKLELAEKVYSLEQAIALVGGKQDQYAGAFGGINFLEFKNKKVKITRLDLEKKFIKKLESKLVIVYVGEHFSGDANKSMIENLNKKNNIQKLLKIKKIAIKMKNALLKRDLASFADLMNQETELRKTLHHSILTSKMKKIIQIAKRNGAIAAKILGSGNNGSILFFGDKNQLIKKFRSRAINFHFDLEGLKWL